MNGGHAAYLWPHLLVMAYPFFKRMNLQQILQLMILRCVKNREHHEAGGFVDFIEYWAGAANLTKEMAT